MNANEFMQLVKEMRTVQKAFIKKKDYAVLQKARILESEVDTAIKNFEKQKTKLQETLF